MNEWIYWVSECTGFFSDRVFPLVANKITQKRPLFGNFEKMTHFSRCDNFWTARPILPIYMYIYVHRYTFSPNQVLNSMGTRDTPFDSVCVVPLSVVNRSNIAKTPFLKCGILWVARSIGPISIPHLGLIRHYTLKYHRVFVDPL